MVLPPRPTGQSGYRRHVLAGEDQGLFGRLSGLPPSSKLHRNLRRLLRNRRREHPRQDPSSKRTADPVPEDWSLSKYDVQGCRRVCPLTRSQTRLICESEVQRDQEDPCGSSDKHSESPTSNGQPPRRRTHSPE